MKFVQLWAPSIYCSHFWGPECLIRLQTSSAASLKAPSTGERGPWKWQPFADPLRSAGLGPSLQHTHTAQYYQPWFSASQKLSWIRSGRLPPASFLCSQICTHAVDSLHTSCEISSAQWSWLLSVLGTGSLCWEAKQNKAKPSAIPGWAFKLCYYTKSCPL